MYLFFIIPRHFSGEKYSVCGVQMGYNDQTTHKAWASIGLLPAQTLIPTLYYVRCFHFMNMLKVLYGFYIVTSYPILGWSLSNNSEWHFDKEVTISNQFDLTISITVALVSASMCSIFHYASIASTCYSTPFPQKSQPEFGWLKKQRRNS